ncbi:hypothetical protein ACFV16_20030 [Streptomyces massasporeus]|uniref:hypothetical protein n=1 Tax=Streptomyces massasporeus TaxID=67324 RepID=UPI00368F3D33
MWDEELGSATGAASPARATPSLSGNGPFGTVPARSSADGTVPSPSTEAPGDSAGDRVGEATCLALWGEELGSANGAAVAVGATPTPAGKDPFGTVPARGSTGLAIPSPSAESPGDSAKDPVGEAARPALWGEELGAVNGAAVAVGATPAPAGKDPFGTVPARGSTGLAIPSPSAESPGDSAKDPVGEAARPASWGEELGSATGAASPARATPSGDGPLSTVPTRSSTGAAEGPASSCEGGGPTS